MLTTKPSPRCSGSTLLLSLVLISMLSILGSVMFERSWINLLMTKNYQYQVQTAHDNDATLLAALKFIATDMQQLSKFNWSQHQGIYAKDTPYTGNPDPRQWRDSETVIASAQSRYIIQYLGKLEQITVNKNQSRPTVQRLQVFKIIAISRGKKKSVYTAQILYSRLDPEFAQPKDPTLPTGIRSWSDL